MKEERVFLYNPWTAVTHGHARNELNLAKDFLRQNGQNAEIISSNKDYGDIHFKIRRPTLSRLPGFLLRGYLFRLLKNQEQKNQVASLLKKLQTLASNNSLHLVVTSCKPNDLILFLNAEFKNISLSIRVISPPESDREIEAFLQINKYQQIIVAFETIDGTAKAEALGGKNILTVPPIQGLANLPDSSSEKSIGIFWPVSYFEPEGKVRSLLQILSQHHCIVRLPGNVNEEYICRDFPNNSYIDRGISDEAFYSYLNKTSLAILPHKGYKLRGSGLAAIFAGMGIPILTDASNSFFADIIGKSEIRQTSSDVLNDIELIKIEETKTKNHTNQYHDWTRLQWTEFVRSPRQKW
jgi:hypothetical protein